MADTERGEPASAEEIVYSILEAELYWDYNISLGLIGALADSIVDRLLIARKLVQGE